MRLIPRSFSVGNPDRCKNPSAASESVVLIGEHLDLALQFVQVKSEGLDLIMQFQQGLIAQQLLPV